MKVIYKYEIPFNSGAYGRFQVETFAVGEFLHVEMQGAAPCIWVEVDTDSAPAVEYLQVVGTGHEVPVGGVYLGTWLDGPYVWHLYALSEKK